MPNRFEAVIFDMDGVLVDTEPIYLNMNQKLFTTLGVEISIEEHQTFVGISANKMWRYIQEKFSLTFSVEELKIMEREMKHQTLSATALEPIQGVREILENLKIHNFKIGLASSSLRKNIDLILQKTGIADYFDCIVAGEEVKNGKPEPDIFLLVSENLGIKPQKCIVIEDSQNGVLAAKRASMFCVGFVNPNSGKQDLSKADIEIQNFNDELLLSMFNISID